MDEKMHGTEWYHSTHLPNLSAKNLVQIGIGGNCCKSWSKFTRDSGCTAISMEDIDKYGIDKVAELALDIAWKGCKAVYVSLDIDVLEAAFCPGTGTPDFGGMLPRELLRLLKLVTAPGICGMDVVEVSPPFDVSEITSCDCIYIDRSHLYPPGDMGFFGTLCSCSKKPVLFYFTLFQDDIQVFFAVV